MKSKFEFLDLEQGSKEWHDLRKKKITSSDAAPILGISPFRGKKHVYSEKVLDENVTFVNYAMQRGNTLEPVARDLFCMENGIKMVPKVAIKDWAMTSLDGITEDGKVILEIKCPGEKTHGIAVSGKVPLYYYAQIQHHLYVTNAEFCFYYSFYDFEGISIKVERDDDFIKDLVAKEKDFYEKYIVEKRPLDIMDGGYIERYDDEWKKKSFSWIEAKKKLKEAEEAESSLRQALIDISNEKPSKGCGISLMQIKRKGSIDYKEIPELAKVDLDLYRKEDITTWRLSSYSENV